MRLGALLVPIGVALFPIGVLLWYGVVHIPAQEAYLNARNLRLLTTLSAAIQAKVESFDGALDHTVESFDPRDPKTTDDVRRQALSTGIQLFAPDLHILKVDSSPRKTNAVANRNGPEPSDIESQLLDEAADPPRVAVARDEGRYYLYLGAEPQAHGRPLRVVA